MDAIVTQLGSTARGRLATAPRQPPGGGLRATLTKLVGTWVKKSESVPPWRCVRHVEGGKTMAAKGERPDVTCRDFEGAYCLLTPSSSERREHTDLVDMVRQAATAVFPESSVRLVGTWRARVCVFGEQCACACQGLPQADEHVAGALARRINEDDRLHCTISTDNRDVALKVTRVDCSDVSVHVYLRSEQTCFEVLETEYLMKCSVKERAVAAILSHYLARAGFPYCSMTVLQFVVESRGDSVWTGSAASLLHNAVQESTSQAWVENLPAIPDGVGCSCSPDVARRRLTSLWESLRANVSKWFRDGRPKSLLPWILSGRDEDMWEKVRFLKYSTTLAPPPVVLKGAVHTDIPERPITECKMVSKPRVLTSKTG